MALRDRGVDLGSLVGWRRAEARHEQLRDHGHELDEDAFGSMLDAAEDEVKDKDKALAGLLRRHGHELGDQAFQRLLEAGGEVVRDRPGALKDLLESHGDALGMARLRLLLEAEEGIVAERPRTLSKLLRSRGHVVDDGFFEALLEAPDDALEDRPAALRDLLRSHGFAMPEARLQRLLDLPEAAVQDRSAAVEALVLEHGETVPAGHLANVLASTAGRRVLGRLVEEERYALLPKVLGTADTLPVDADLGAGNTLLHLATLLGDVGVMRAVLDRGARVDATNANGATALHIAAGVSWQACEALLDAGARMSALDLQRRTPLARAQRVSKRRLDDAALAERQAIIGGFRAREWRVATVRGGSGSAVEDAINGNWVIRAVEWYNLPSGGWGNAVGIHHSLLKIETERTTASGAIERRDFAVEKAATTREVLNDRRVKNGVFVSPWPQVAGIPGLRRMRRLEAADLRDASVTMTRLYERGQATGPYHLTEANCSHFAFDLYNFCARDDKQFAWHASEDANMFFTDLAKRLPLPSLEAFAPASSESRSEIAAPALPFGLERTEPQPSAATLDRHADAMLLSDWIYRPSQRLASSLMLPLRNLLDRDVQVTIVETNTRFLLKPGASEAAELPLPPGETLVTVTIRVDFLGLLGFTSPRTMLCSEKVDVQDRGDEAFDISDSPTKSGAVGLRRRRHLPGHLLCHASGVHFSDANHLVQWARIDVVDRAERVTFVSFRGTDNGMDAIIDAGILRSDTAFPNAGIEVHASMWTALERGGRHAVLRQVDAIAAEVASNGFKLVLTGHSLGGGYAVLAGMHLLQQEAMRELDLEVVTFGAPQVVALQSRDEEEEKVATSEAKVPPRLPPLWKALHDRTAQYINGCDPVPRLPSSEAWVQWMLQNQISVGSASTHVVVGFLKNYLGRVLGFAEHARTYDAIGTLSFIAKDFDYVQHVPVEPAGRTHRDILDAPPRSATSALALVAFHSAAAYGRILEELREQSRIQALPADTSELGGSVCVTGADRPSVFFESRDWVVAARA